VSLHSQRWGLNVRQVLYDLRDGGLMPDRSIYDLRDGGLMPWWYHGGLMPWWSIYDLRDGGLMPWLYESYVVALELCRCIVRDGSLMSDRSFMTLEMGA
jgi:hypothetical protein